MLLMWFLLKKKEKKVNWTHKHACVRMARI
jgi:hypothetical protein